LIHTTVTVPFFFKWMCFAMIFQLSVAFPYRPSPIARNLPYFLPSFLDFTRFLQ